MANPHDDLPESQDNLYRGTDGLLRRRRGRHEADYRDPPADFPILTEVVQDSQPAPATEAPEVAAPSTPPAAEPRSVPPRSAATPSDDDLALLEQDLRLQLLELLGPEFERLIEAKVHERLGVKIDEVMSLTRTVIEAEVRAVIREALAEVIAAETERLKIELNLG